VESEGLFAKELIGHRRIIVLHDIVKRIQIRDGGRTFGTRRMPPDVALLRQLSFPDRDESA
jgi:hypothetical protein